MSLTAAQQSAVSARGNVLVMAGAGTGKTSTLVARCLDCLGGDPPASLDQLLVVTFTEAAAAEARERIRAALDARFTESGDEHWARQLALFDAAHIGTLHGFCFKLIRQHFYQLGLDPQVAVLDEGQARLLAEETLGELLEEQYSGTSPDALAVQDLIETYAGGRDEAIRRLVLQLHHYGQTRPDPRDWLAQQLGIYSSAEPAQWSAWLLAGIAEWRGVWLAELENLRGGNAKAAECADILRALKPGFDRHAAAECVGKLLAADNSEWPKKQKTVLRKPLEGFFADAEFLATLAPPERRSPTRRESDPASPHRAGSEIGALETDPLTEDWHWCRGPMLALLRLAGEFTARFAERKRAEGAVDFHDLEQLALQLLWDSSPRRASPIAQHWREKLRFVFVDEYQDINAAQDQIITALSRDGAEANRFLVGDVKQSIYRFRLAEPGIFRAYARDWKAGAGTALALAENFRSRAAILEFANAVFAPLMREEIGGVSYDTEARLIPGLPPEGLRIAVNVEPQSEAASAHATRNTQPAAAEPDVEIRFRLTERSAAASADDGALDDLRSAEREARHIALRLRELKASGLQILDRETKQTRAIMWRDMAVLLRAPAAKAEGYAKQFERAGVPLTVERGGFFETLEVADLLNVLRLLDNPLQDVPLLAVLRSPLAGCSLDELATIRLAARGYFWTALVRWYEVLRVACSVKQQGTPPTILDATRNTQHAASLLAKVDSFLTRIARWRQLARHAALSKCLDEILAETHYADWLRTQARGAQRHGNVQRLLGLAEQFDQFQRQGLFRFLRFVDAQREAGAEPEVAAAGAEDAVRLMSIHQSKGLEFPVVVVADLGKPFNLRDLNGEIMLDEDYGLCPQVHPPGRGARYRSAAQWLAQQRQRREMLGEELRLLYVALTRAREKLILTGSLSRKRWEDLATVAHVTPLAILKAKCAAEWLGLWLAVHGGAATQCFQFRELDDAGLVEPAGVAAESPLVSTPPLDDDTFERLRRMLEWQYPFPDATQRAAKTSVTALRRAAAETLIEEAEQRFAPRFRRRAGRSTGLSAADIGNAHHTFLQHLTLDQAGGETALRNEARRLAQERVLSAAEVATLDFAALERFWTSTIGQAIRAEAANVRRELPFTARFSPGELDRLVKHAPGAEVSGEFVIVQGVADLVVLRPEEIWLLDFKTDEVTPDAVAVKTDFYRPQLELYAHALERIFAQPVTRRWLHFLACGETVELQPTVAAAPVR